MLRFLAAVAVVLAVLAAGALIVAMVVSRAAPLAAKLEAWWARRTASSGAAGRPGEDAARSIPLAAMQGDDFSTDVGDGGAGDGGAGGDGG